MPSDKYSYTQGGFHYENLKNFIETGEGIPSKSAKPNPQYRLTQDFVNEIRKMSQNPNVTLPEFQELANRFNVGHLLVKKYYRAYRCLLGLEVVETDNKKADVKEVDYQNLLKNHNELLEKYERLETLNNYNEEELINSSVKIDKLMEEILELRRKVGEVIKIIGYDRWKQL